MSTGNAREKLAALGVDADRFILQGAVRAAFSPRAETLDALLYEAAAAHGRGMIVVLARNGAAFAACVQLAGFRSWDVGAGALVTPHSAVHLQAARAMRQVAFDGSIAAFGDTALSMRAGDDHLARLFAALRWSRS